MHGIKKTFLVVLITSFTVFSLTGCGGRRPNPVATYYPTDEILTCKSLKSAMGETQENIDKLIPQTKKTGKNIAIGAAAVLVFLPAIFLLDFSDAEKVEIEAYRNRYNHLARLYNDKQCIVGDGTKVVEMPKLEEPLTIKKSA